MIPTETRTARARGIVACIKHLLSENLATLYRMPASGVAIRTISSGAIISIYGKDAGTDADRGTKTAGQAGSPGKNHQYRATDRGARGVAWCNRSTAV